MDFIYLFMLIGSNSIFSILTLLFDRRLNDVQITRPLSQDGFTPIPLRLKLFDHTILLSKLIVTKLKSVIDQIKYMKMFVLNEVIHKLFIVGT